MGKSSFAFFFQYGDSGFNGWDLGVSDSNPLEVGVEVVFKPGEALKLPRGGSGNFS